MFLLLLAMVFFIGLVGGSAFLLVRQALERISGHAGDNFESRVLDELEVLRLRLDRISEHLDVPVDSGIGPVDLPPGRHPGDSEAPESSA